MGRAPGLVARLRRVGPRSAGQWGAGSLLQLGVAGPPSRLVEFGPCTRAIVEGVSSGRRDFAPFLSSLVWVEAPRPLRLARGLERDGADAAAQWQSWIAAEDEYFAVHEPDRHADFVVDGAADLPEEQVPD